MQFVLVSECSKLECLFDVGFRAKRASFSVAVATLFVPQGFGSGYKFLLAFPPNPPWGFVPWGGGPNKNCAECCTICTCENEARCEPLFVIVKFKGQKTALHSRAMCQQKEHTCPPCLSVHAVLCTVHVL